MMSKDNFRWKRRELLSVSLPVAHPVTPFQCSECGFQSKVQVLHQSGGEDMLYDAQGMEAWTANSVQTSALTKPAWVC